MYNLRRHFNKLNQTVTRQKSCSSSPTIFPSPPEPSNRFSLRDFETSNCGSRIVLFKFGQKSIKCHLKCFTLKCFQYRVSKKKKESLKPAQYCNEIIKFVIGFHLLQNIQNGCLADVRNLTLQYLKYDSSPWTSLTS